MKRSKQSGFTLMELLVLIAITVLFLALMIPACNNAKVKQKQKELQTNAVVKIVPVSYGHDVYYFPFIGDNFRKEVALFLEKHSELEVIASDSDVERQLFSTSGVSHMDVGITTGHTVFFRKKQN